MPGWLMLLLSLIAAAFGLWAQLDARAKLKRSTREVIEAREAYSEALAMFEASRPSLNLGVHIVKTPSKRVHVKRS